jgi:PPOX class probable F420-dependent enzyme
MITLSMRRSFPAGVHRAGASRTCHPGRYAALTSPDPIHNFRSYLRPDSVTDKTAHLGAGRRRIGGQPQASPVWFLWEGTTILIFRRPAAPKLRNPAANPRVTVHLDSDGAGGDVVTIDATAAVDPDAPPAHQLEGYLAKYRPGIQALGWTRAQLARDFWVAIRIRPVRVPAW